MVNHPDFEAEQAYIDRAYEYLAAMRASVSERLRSALGSGGGTPQAVLEREVVVDSSLHRLEQLDIGSEVLCFGRIDREGSVDGGPPDEVFHIGRIAVSGPEQEPVIVDWRAPVAEPFYRATGRHPMNLRLRRHFSVERRRITGIEDEHFASGGPAGPGDPDDDGDDLPLAGPGALLAAMDRGRTGSMRDIVATVQSEQDEIIRADLPGILVVQGGPGTGKTAVALHRAAYLLYTHRFPLERQGVLVVGPNPVFLRYIERVLPSLGETGVSLSTPAGLVADAVAKGRDSVLAAKTKSSERMVAVIAKAVRDRERSLPSDVQVPYGVTTLTIRRSDTSEIVGAVRHRPGTHNARRRQIETLVFRRLHAQLVTQLERRREHAGGTGPEIEVTVDDVAQELRRHPDVVAAFERIWPRLTPQELLHDLFGAPALIDLAASSVLSDEERASLRRPRSESPDTVLWTTADLALIDEARVLLGPAKAGGAEGDGALRTFGHIVLDEAQDLTPMQLRMIARRSMSGSMTVVGDVAQATGPDAGSGWSAVLRHLPSGRAPRTVELSVNYRTPVEIMDLAGRVLAVTDPELHQPRSVRALPPGPTAISTGTGDAFSRAVSEAARLGGEGAGTVALICSAADVSGLGAVLDAAGLAYGEAATQGIEQAVSLVGIDVAKGLEFDAVVVVEPDSIVAEAGLRALYVALTRATRRLALVHSRPLPDPLAGALTSAS